MKKSTNDKSRSEKIQALIKTSKGVISSCVLENGAIVAANSDKSYYPKDAYNYRYVWPRDAAFTMIAADLLDLNIHNNYMRWLLTRAEDFLKDGLLLQNYYTNGLKRWHNFQPDSNALTLIAMHMHFGPDLSDDAKAVAKLLADGLCNVWDRTHFNQETQDLWESRSTFPDLDDNFTYTLASTISGLRSAYKMLRDQRYKMVAEEMNQRFKRHGDLHFIRSFGRLPDERIDASLIFLAYPFDVISPDDPKMMRTVSLIEQKLVRSGGVMRFEDDDYDGWRCHGKDRLKGAGTWPLLNFALSIYYASIDRDKAMTYYNQVIDRVDNYIPEQFFENDIQVSVKPLAWSHSMFVIASKVLGLWNG